MKEDIKMMLLKIDELNQSITLINKEKEIIYNALSFKKKEIEQNNLHLIGRKAMCIHIDNPNPVECVCTSVVALEDFINVKPLFSRNGKKYIIETFEWIN